MLVVIELMRLVTPRKPLIAIAVAHLPRGAVETKNGVSPAAW